MLLYGTNKSDKYLQLIIIKLILEIITVIFAVLFCAINIFFHRNQLPFVIAYSVLGGLSILYFLYFLFLYEEFDKKDNKAVKKTVRYLKLITRGIIVILSIYELSQGDMNFWRVLLTIFVLALFLIRITIEIILILISLMFKQFKKDVSNNMDKLFYKPKHNDKDFDNLEKEYNNKKDDDNVIDITIDEK